MPRFFFDIDDGQHHIIDDEGAAFGNAEEARKELVGSLAAIAKDQLPDGNIRDFVGTLRDDSSKTLFDAKLSLRSGWVEHSDRQALDDAIQECRQVRLNLGNRAGFRARVLLDMILVELGTKLAMLTLDGDAGRPNRDGPGAPPA